MNSASKDSHHEHSEEKNHSASLSKSKKNKKKKQKKNKNKSEIDEESNHDPTEVFDDDWANKFKLFTFKTPKGMIYII